MGDDKVVDTMWLIGQAFAINMSQCLLKLQRTQ